MQIKFIGATETVTGSMHLIETENNFSILLDCGLYQGLGQETDVLNRQLHINPSQIDVVLLSHAHIDHSGNLPLLVKQGFLGSIYCTPPTRKVVELLLFDSANIHESEIEYINKEREILNQKPLEPLYNSHDVERCIKHVKTIPYNQEFYLNNTVSFTFTDIGHILGSAAINLKFKHATHKTTYLTYTGDIGKYDDIILNNPLPFPQADYIICESTYGDRLHKHSPDFDLQLLNIIRKTCIEKKGKLIIPAFSLGRTQELVFILNKLKNKNMLPDINIYIDSPLSTSITNIMKEHMSFFNKSFNQSLLKDSNPFEFENLKYIIDKEESKALTNTKKPCIIIAASGMMDGGRIKHHLIHHISNSKNTILIVGYCTPNSLGGKIKNGEKSVKIFDEFYDVNAEIEMIEAFSAHADYAEIIKFLSCQNKSNVNAIYLVHGDSSAKISFKEKLIKEGFKRVIIPHKNEVITIN